jgi:hypothetical protein
VRIEWRFFPEQFYPPSLEVREDLARRARVCEQQVLVVEVIPKVPRVVLDILFISALRDEGAVSSPFVPLAAESQGSLIHCQHLQLWVGFLGRDRRH